MNTGEQLCLACGLCCDGTLFDNVRFGPRDDPAKTKALGMPVKKSRARDPVHFFRQPCAALCSDRACRIYQNRPSQCRSFECGVFKGVVSEEIKFEAGLRLIKRAQQKAKKARGILVKMGERDEKLSLGARFRRIQRQLESGTLELDASTGDLFADLGLTMHQLDMLAHEKFYTEAES